MSKQSGNAVLVCAGTVAHCEETVRERRASVWVQWLSVSDHTWNAVCGPALSTRIDTFRAVGQGQVAHGVFSLFCCGIQVVAVDDVPFGPAKRIVAKVCVHPKLQSAINYPLRPGAWCLRREARSTCWVGRRH